MELNRNSISAKLNRWFYDENKMPSNLCPYFWKLIAMWIFIIPFSIISIPVIILEKINQEKFYAGNILLKILVSLVLYVGLYGITTMFISLITIWFVSKDIIIHYNYIYIVGTLLDLFGLIWLIYFGVDKIVNYYSFKKYWKNKEEPKKESSIIKEFIKAKYNKYCPKIDWK